MNAEFKLYVGTYGKYNNGSIDGEWLDLSDYNDSQEFLAACAELHKDEHDPEFMFQDFEGFPRDFYSESHANPFLWILIEYLKERNMDETTEEVFLDYLNGFANSDNFSKMDLRDFTDFCERESLDNITLADQVDIEYQFFRDKGFTNDQIDKFSSFIDGDHLLKNMEYEDYKFTRTDKYTTGQHSRVLYACLFYVETRNYDQ